MATCPHCGGPAYPDDPCDCNAARLETLLADNQEATHEVAVWRNRYEDLKAALRDKDTALAESGALVMNHEGHIARLEDELEKLQGRLDDSEAENGNLGEECGHLEEELERLKLYESEHERLKVELNQALHPSGDGPKAPSFCDLVAYVESDLRKLRECKAELGRLRERLQFDPGGSDKIDELEQALDMTKASLAAVRAELDESKRATECARAWREEAKKELAAARAENKSVRDDLEQLVETSKDWLIDKLGDEQYARLVSSFRVRQDDASRVERELLTRIVKYAVEDRMRTPGSTRLARAILEARRLLGIPNGENYITLAAESETQTVALPFGESTEMPASAHHDEKPLCPQCQGPLVEIRYPADSYLNRDQWESQIAGNWLCEKCPDNGRANNKKCYWWNREVFIVTADGRKP